MNGSTSLTSQTRRSAVQRLKSLENFGNINRFVGHRLMLEPRSQMISFIFVHTSSRHSNSDAKKPSRLPISIPAFLHPDKFPTPEHVLGLLEIPQNKDTIRLQRANPSNLRCGTQKVYAQALQNSQLKRKLMLALAFVLKSLGATTMLRWLSFIALLHFLQCLRGGNRASTISASISKMMVDNKTNETR